MSDEVIKYLRGELEAALTEHVQLDELLRQKAARRITVRGLIDSYAKILKEKDALNGFETQLVHLTAHPSPFASTNGQSKEEDKPKEEKRLSKLETFIGILQKYGDVGATQKELIDEMVRFYTNFPVDRIYNYLSKVKARGIAEKKKDRFVITEKGKEFAVVLPDLAGKA